MYVCMHVCMYVCVCVCDCRGFLKARITEELGLPCYDPANGTTVAMPTRHRLPVDISPRLVSAGVPLEGDQGTEPAARGKRLRLETVQPRKRMLLDGILLAGDGASVRTHPPLTYTYTRVYTCTYHQLSLYAHRPLIVTPGECFSLSLCARALSIFVYAHIRVSVCGCGWDGECSHRHRGLWRPRRRRTRWACARTR
jgi:hypothetical protein